jgi:hypothetical protein
MSLPTRFVKMAGGGTISSLRRMGAPRRGDRRRIALLSRRPLRRRGRSALSIAGRGLASTWTIQRGRGLAPFCANGTRCAARCAVTRGLVDGRDPVLKQGGD